MEDMRKIALGLSTALLVFVAGCSGGKYIEARKDGRLYIMGKQETADSFAKHGHMPYTRTLIGEGPNGETVVFEVDKKDEALADRLQREFEKRYKKK